MGGGGEGVGHCRAVITVQINDIKEQQRKPEVFSDGPKEKLFTQFKMPFKQSALFLQFR